VQDAARQVTGWIVGVSETELPAFAAAVHWVVRL